MLAGVRALVLIAGAITGPILMWLLFAVRPEGLLRRGRRQWWTPAGMLAAALMLVGVCAMDVALAPRSWVLVWMGVDLATTGMLISEHMGIIRAWWIARRPYDRWKTTDIEAILKLAQRRGWVVAMQPEQSRLHIEIETSRGPVHSYPQPQDQTPTAFLREFADKAYWLGSVRYVSITCGQWNGLRVRPLKDGKVMIEELV